VTTPDPWTVAVPTGYRVGSFEITGGIADGSWGSVYAGRRVGIGAGDLPAVAALKFLPTGTTTPRQLRHLAAVARREEEARRLPSHPGLVRTYQVLTVDDPDQGELDGCVVLVMERAHSTLSTLLEKSPGRPVPGASQLLAQIWAALSHMHQAGWVHGDLKPSNVLVMTDGSIRLTDFGLTAKLEGTHAYLPPAGSSDYTPPDLHAELLTERGRCVRTGTDLWAFGVTAYQLLTGRLPFPGTTPRARAAAAAEYANGRTELVVLDVLPPGWCDVVARCLAPGAVRPTQWVDARIRELANPDGAPSWPRPC
jgi:serine/threonine protein kinase